MQKKGHIPDDRSGYMEAIAMLKFHSEQNHLRANQCYARTKKTAMRSSIIVFIVMSYFMHAELLGGTAEVTTHILAFIVNIISALITSIMIREFHPSQTNASIYWQASMEYERQIVMLEHEMKTRVHSETPNIPFPGIIFP